MTDNLSNRLKDALHKQFFGKMFEVKTDIDVASPLLKDQAPPESQDSISFSLNQD